VVVSCVLGRTFRILFGRQHSVIQTGLIPPEKLPLGSPPSAGGGRRAGIRMKSKSQMALPSMGKKTFEGKQTTVACVCSHIYLETCPHLRLVDHAHCRTRGCCYFTVLRTPYTVMRVAFWGEPS